MSARASRLDRALEWVARLPLLGEAELALLLGAPEREARALRLELERLGWTEWLVPGEPGLPGERLSCVREAALPELARRLGVAEGELPAHVPVRRADVLDRIVRVGTAAGVNRFLAELAADPGVPGVELEDARSLPLDLPRRERWWPAGVDGYGCLRAGSLRAPFFVAWDRGAAPDEHRRLRARGWAGPAPAAGGSWGREGMPPVLVVPAGRRAAPAWERAASSAADPPPAGPPGILIASGEGAADGPAGATWLDPLSGRGGPLLDQLGWGDAPPLRHVRVEEGAGHPVARAATAPLRRCAAAEATAPGTPAAGRLAALAMATDADEKRMLEFVGRWPLITAGQLAGLAALPYAAVERRLQGLRRLGAVRVDCEAQPGEPVGAGELLLLTPLGLRLLARRDGVPVRRYARLAGVSAPHAGAAGTEPPPGATPPLRHHAHQLGLNRAAAWLASEARAAGGRLASCRNEAESTRRFRHGDGASWVRPDASGVLVLGGRALPFLLEYDRGTLDSGDFRAKLAGYGRYYAGEAWRHDHDEAPGLLFVCSDPGAEARVERAVRLALAGSGTPLPVVLMTEKRSGWGRPEPRVLGGGGGP